MATSAAEAPLAQGPVPSGDRRWRRRPLLSGAVGLTVGFAAVLATGWLGLQVTPSPLPPSGLAGGTVTTTTLPAGLPAPVARFYRALYGDRIPVVHSAVISGRGTMRIAGITFPARFRFTHDTGQAYRHYIELTVFGAGVTDVDEWFVDGRARLELPVGVSEGPEVDQGANLALWAEAVWMPSVWITDPRVAWEPVDDDTARLTVPFGDARETFTVTFDHDTGLLASLESQRFKGEGAATRTGWLNHAPAWGDVDGHPVPLHTTVTWADEGSPWAALTTEHVIYNADLHIDLQISGP